VGSMIENLYKIHKESIPDYEGKIWVNVTGGLDSRVLAYLISQKREIDFGFYYYGEETKHNLVHISNIVKQLDFNEFAYIKMDKAGYGQFDAAVERTGKSPCKYTYVVNSYGDGISTRFTKKSRERKFYLNIYGDETDMPKTKFREIDMPLWNPRLVGYMHSLPRWQRWYQKAYIQMIKDYMPEIADIPRCFEFGHKPVKMNSLYLLGAAWQKYTK